MITNYELFTTIAPFDNKVKAILSWNKGVERLHEKKTRTLKPSIQMIMRYTEKNRFIIYDFCFYYSIIFNLKNYELIK